MQKNYTTVGVDFLSKDIEIKNEKFKIQIWDTAGEELFKSIASNFYKECHGVVICYDVTNRKSFENLGYWLNEIKNFSVENVGVIIIGTKTDLREMRTVTTEEGVKFASENQTLFYEVSAIADEYSSVRKGIDLLIERLLNSIRENELKVTNLNKSTSSKITVKATPPMGVDCCST